MSRHVTQKQVRKIGTVIGGIAGVIAAFPVAAGIEGVSLIATKFIGGSAIGREVADKIKRKEGGE